MTTIGRTYEEVTAELNAPIPRDAISTREGGGKTKLSYLQGHYVIDRLNRVLGIGNWAYTSKRDKVFEGRISKRDYNGKEVETNYVAYTAEVRLVVELPPLTPGGMPVKTEFVDVGFGDGEDRFNPAKPHELASKEAVTDALKRAAKNLGMSMGLALYDKTQENVIDTPAPASTKPSVEKVRGISVPEEAPKAAAHSTSKPTNDRTAELIGATSRAIVKKGLATTEQLKDLLRQHGAETKESLTPEKATAFLEMLTTMLSPPTTQELTNV